MITIAHDHLGPIPDYDLEGEDISRWVYAAGLKPPHYPVPAINNMALCHPVVLYMFQEDLLAKP